MAAADTPTKRRFMEFSTANIRNPNTRKAYARAAGDFLHWCDGRGVTARCLRNDAGVGSVNCAVAILDAFRCQADLEGIEARWIIWKLW
jgi:hypothetical protein